MPQSKPPKKSSFIQRHLIITLTITCILVFIGFGVSFFTIQLSMERNQTGGPILLFARVLEKLGPQSSPEKVFKIFEEDNPDVSPFIFYLLDENGKELASANRSYLTPPKILDNIKEELPLVTGKVKRLGDLRFSPYFPTIIKLNLNPTRYLIVSHKRATGPQRNTMNIVMGVVLSCTLLAALISFTVLLSHMRKNASAIERVIASIREGDLKARFNIRKFDEVGQLMTKFNEMADEIEQLVGRIRKNEKIRVNILQELGHDFRTPLASLKNSLEMLHSKEFQLMPEQKEKLFDLALKEVDYLAPLVDNLLFLANIEDPRFLKKTSEIPMAEFLSEEIESFQNKITQDEFYQKVNKTVIFQNDVPEDFRFFGDKFLLERMIRNILENSIKFAKQRVSLKVYLDSEEKSLNFLFEDDGPGFNPEVMSNYGERKFSRVLDESANGKISLGLGSVIVKAIANFHSGTVVTKNITDQNGNVSGASVWISFKANQGDSSTYFSSSAS